MFTAAEVAQIKNAIISLSTGGAVEVQIGDRRYRKPELRELMKLYDFAKSHQSGQSSIVGSKFTHKGSL